MLQMISKSFHVGSGDSFAVQVRLHDLSVTHDVMISMHTSSLAASRVLSNEP